MARPRTELRRKIQPKAKKSATQGVIKSGRVQKPTTANAHSRKPMKKMKSFHGFGLGVCPICLDELGEHTRLIASTICGHVFCLRCLQQVLKNQKSCPTCRGSLNGISTYVPLYLDPEEVCPNGEIEYLPYGPESECRDN